MTAVLFGFLGLALGAIIVYLVLRPKMQAAQKLDQETAVANARLSAENSKLHNEIEVLAARRLELNSSIEALQKQSEQAAEAIYKSNMESMQERLSTASEAAGRKYQQEEEQYQAEYLAMMEECTQRFQSEIAEKRIQLAEVEALLSELKAKSDASVEANRRAYEMQQKKDFYRLVLSEADLLEIERLREVTPFLRDSEPLNKVIWKVYYENAYTDMIGRVVGKGVHTGIYKITNLENGMCYVGQAVNIADRWRQHIKRGIGAEPVTRNKLYPAMMSIGVENFSFEIIEECDRSKLNEREDYWQDFYQAKEFGYSIK